MISLSSAPQVASYVHTPAAFFSMTRARPSWQELADQLHVERICAGVQPNGQPCYENHERGSITSERGMVVHWRSRLAWRSLIPRFLYLIAYERSPSPDEWRRHYRALRLAIRYSQEAGVRLPASAWEEYRIRLKSMLLRVPTTDPERQEAADWVQH